MAPSRTMSPSVARVGTLRGSFGARCRKNKFAPCNRSTGAASINEASARWGTEAVSVGGDTEPGCPTKDWRGDGALAVIAPNARLAQR